jgi:hypothetical protein
LKHISGAETLQDELAKLSSSGTRQVVEGATHMSIVTNQEFPRAVVQALRDCISLAPATGSPLPDASNRGT